MPAAAKEVPTRRLSKDAKKARRREQNRNAQRALRERKESRLQELENLIEQLRKEQETTVAENESLQEIIARLDAENAQLRDIARRTSQSPELGRLAPEAGPSKPARPTRSLDRYASELGPEDDSDDSSDSSDSDGSEGPPPFVLASADLPVSAFVPSLSGGQRDTSVSSDAALKTESWDGSNKTETSLVSAADSKKEEDPAENPDQGFQGILSADMQLHFPGNPDYGNIFLTDAPAETHGRLALCSPLLQTSSAPPTMMSAVHSLDAHLLRGSSGFATASITSQHDPSPPLQPSASEDLLMLSSSVLSFSPSAGQQLPLPSLASDSRHSVAASVDGSPRAGLLLSAPTTLTMDSLSFSPQLSDLRQHQSPTTTLEFDASDRSRSALTHGHSIPFLYEQCENHMQG